MKALTILKKAKALIDAGRWTTGEFEGAEHRINVRTGRRLTKDLAVTCYCADGAIRKAGKNDFRNYAAAESIFLKALGRPGGGTEEIWDWNDDPKRTIGEVRKAFRDAVRLAETAA